METYPLTQPVPQTKRNRRQSGFTLIELVLVILLLGIMSLTAFSIFYDISDEAYESTEMTIVSSVRSGIDLSSMENMINLGTFSFPTTLDSATNGTASPSNPFFTEVLNSGITENWNKSGPNLYLFAPTGTQYLYDSNTGKFEEQ